MCADWIFRGGKSCDLVQSLLRHVCLSLIHPALTTPPHQSSQIQGGAKQVYSCEYTQHSLFLYYYLLTIILFFCMNNCKSAFASLCIYFKNKMSPKGRDKWNNPIEGTFQISKARLNQRPSSQGDPGLDLHCNLQVQKHTPAVLRQHTAPREETWRALLQSGHWV